MSTGNKASRPTGAVIVAAGMSSRMKSFKPMLPLAGATIIRTIIGTLQKAGVSPVLVVTGRNSRALSEHIADLPVETIENIDYAKTDMFFSACLGLKAIANRCERVFFLPGDVPLFSRYSLNAMNEYMDAHACDILIPAYYGRQGHPVLIKTAAVEELTSFQGPGGLRAAIKNYGGKKEKIALPDRGLILDADNPEDYRRLTEYSADAMSAAPLTCSASITLNKNAGFFDGELAALLELAHKYGSLTKACKQAGISYSNGWKRIKFAEQQLGFVLLQSSRGGAGGGGSGLTQRGKAFLKAYRKLSKSVDRYCQKQFNKYFIETADQ